jgi:hypothetical protein
VNPAVKWMRVLHDPLAHAVTNEDGARGWRPLCQQSDMASGLLLREANDRDDAYCDTCRMVYGSRVRMAIQRRKRSSEAAS